MKYARALRESKIPRVRDPDPNSGSRTRDLLANRQEPTAGTPIKAVPFEAESTQRVKAIETRHAATAIDLRNGAESDDRVLALLFGKAFSEGKQVLDLAKLPGILGVRGFDESLHFLRRDVATEVEEVGFRLDDTGTCDWELLRGDVDVYPVIAASRDHLIERSTVVDREKDGSREQCPETEELAEAVPVRNGPTHSRFDQVGKSTPTEELFLEDLSSESLLHHGVVNLPHKRK